MSISSPGLGSGLDIKSMVEGLVKADIMPAQARLDKRFMSVNTQLSAMGQLKSALSNFQTTLSSLSLRSDLYKTQCSLSEAGYISASMTEQASEGVYQIKVKQLAQAQTLASTYFADNTTPVGNGSMTINFGTYTNNNTTFTLNSKASPVTIHFDTESNSLSALCETINAANAGVVASIVQDNAGSRLTLTSKETGENYAMQIVSDLSALNYDPTTNNTQLTQTMAAQNSQVEINGLLVNQNSNHLDTALTGIKLNLQQADPDTTITVTVKKDTEHTKTVITDFVKKYNDFMSFLTNLTGFNMATRKRGVLQGDALLRELKSNVYSLVTNPLPSGGPIQSLADLGITSNKQGVLEIDPEILDKVLESNYESVGDLFAKKAIATDPNIKINSFDTDVQAGSYDVVLTEYTQGTSLAGTIGGFLGSSKDGKVLTGSGDLSTLSIEVLSGTLGSRGQIRVTDGLASLINNFFTSYLDEDGDLEERIDHLDDKVKQLAEEQKQIDIRTSSLEKKYYKQWNALDLLIAQMQNTSSTLTQLLSNIPKLKTK